MEQIVAAIVSGQISSESPLPASRILARQLGVGRNTVTLAYERLKDDGILISRERSGYFVNPLIIEQGASRLSVSTTYKEIIRPNWSQRLRVKPSIERNIKKPRDWKNYLYPFIYGQLDFDLFPTNHWRECCRDAVSVGSIKEWADDHFGDDDPLLVDQILKHILPSRGVWADPAQILITVGAQHGLYMIARLFLNGAVTLGVENPGYVDIRNIAALTSAKITALPIDTDGLIISENVDSCDYIYVTPSHQSPTTVTMPLRRRYELLKHAVASRIVIIEDDYESETTYETNPTPALKSLDQNDRVLYVGSMSKTLAPGLRIGYIVASSEVITELRALRRLILRHPAANNQRSVALFLARGYHHTLTRSLIKVYKERYTILKAAMDRYLPESIVTEPTGGSSVWVKGPEFLDALQLRARAAKQGILIEPGNIHFLADKPPRNFFRLGFSSITEDKIEPGVKLLSKIIDDMA